MIVIQVRCISCSTVRNVGEEESKELSRSMNIPMCECGSPMLATKVETRRPKRVAT